ncbi:biotin--[acetyl-CoA-carboxylase] ligase [Glaciimonas soli]|uniref:biotin--[biotin carboxyl-carrier protein] ligase n=1 Tax=Glaciimonas soli TaxID=2590999 RepID=A0A843YSN2_9BURK|nr:biotin--[acetyl-CoA-carboxylase] ligase [Glaciimonas soli]MQR00583.1 biotin--[acetyl-CoA-carboxylase] ligase [Glaciimonas soli]
MTSHLSAERIFALSAVQPDDITIEVVTETGSTNADLLTRIQSAPTATKPILRIAENQTAGRGRAGRAWLSTPETALMFSFAWPFARSVQDLVGLPLAVGATIATAITHFLGKDVGIRLKWPNDLMLDSNKLGGILIETTSTTNAAAKIAGGAAKKQTWAVIGVGLNLAVPASLQQDIGRNIANLPAPVDLDRDALMAALLCDLILALQSFEQHGLHDFIGQWNQLDAYANQEVKILDQEKVVHEGTALGIDQTGRLLLQTTDQRIAIMAGDISLRVKVSQ